MGMELVGIGREAKAVEVYVDLTPGNQRCVLCCACCALTSHVLPPLLCAWCFVFCHVMVRCAC